MTPRMFAAVVITVLLVAVAIKKRRPRRGASRTRRHGTPGPGAAGAMYDLLNEERRKAIEIIVEDKAAYRVAEHTDDVPPNEP